MLSAPKEEPEELEPPEIVLVPLGDPSPELVRLVAGVIRSRFVLRVRVADAMPMPGEAYYAPRKRWRAERLLEAIEAEHTDASVRLIGVTERPISTTKDQHVDWGIAGLGIIRGRSCVVTQHVYKKLEGEALARAMENNVLHELGHVFGLPHCSDARCAVADANGNAVRAAEKSSGEYCAKCARKISTFLRSTPPKWMRPK
jgi:archaemetzincin